MEITLFLDAVRKSELLAPPHLLAYQQRLLRRLLDHAVAMPFWAERLKTLKHPDGWDFERWEHLPILTRDVAMAAGTDLHAKTYPEATKGWQPFQTRGTSGLPLSVRRSGLDLIAGNTNQQRLFEEHAFDGKLALAFIAPDPAGLAPYPFGKSGHGWFLNEGFGPVHHLDDQTPIRDQAEWLFRTEPSYLLHRTDVLAEIAEGVASGALPPLSFKALVTRGSTLDEAGRHRLASVFGAVVIDSYPTREFGLLAYERRGGGYAVMAETVMLEILDEQGRAVPAGVPGRVVVSSFYNYAMPLIRYFTGDIAIADHVGWADGRNSPRLKRILGREAVIGPKT